MGPWPSSSTALASLGRAGCPQLAASLYVPHKLPLSGLFCQQGLSQQWSSYSGVCWSQSDLLPPRTHWFYSLGGCSDQTYTLGRRWCLQSAVNSNKLCLTWADIWMESMRDHSTNRIALLSSFVLFLSSFFFLSSLPLFLPHSFPSFPSFLSSILPSFLPSLSLLLSRYSYQSPAMENTEFLLAHWYCAGVDSSALWTGLSETTWSVQGGHWHFINTAWWPMNLRCPIFFRDLNLKKQWNKKWTKKCKRQRKKEGREGITWYSSYIYIIFSLYYIIFSKVRPLRKTCTQSMTIIFQKEEHQKVEK